PRGAEPGHVRPWQVCCLRLAALAEGEHVEPLVPRTQRVRLENAVDDAVAGTDLEGAIREQADTRAGEPEEDLLLAGLAVERRRPLARIDLNPGDADRLRPGGGAEIGPETRDVAGFRAAALDLVPVREHAPIMSRAGAVRGARPPPPRPSPASPAR